MFTLLGQIDDAPSDDLANDFRLPAIMKTS